MADPCVVWYDSLSKDMEFMLLKRFSQHKWPWLGSCLRQIVLLWWTVVLCEMKIRRRIWKICYRNEHYHFKHNLQCNRMHCTQVRFTFIRDHEVLTTLPPGFISEYYCKITHFSLYEGHPINRENFLIMQKCVPLEHGNCNHSMAWSVGHAAAYPKCCWSCLATKKWY